MNGDLMKVTDTRIEGDERIGLAQLLTRHPSS